MKAKPDTPQIDPDELLRSFAARREEADPSAEPVLDEFIRVAEHLSADAEEWRDIVALDESWRITLSDSQVIRILRALHPNRARPKRRGR